MKVLVDTHALLWATREPERLSERAHGLMRDSPDRLVFSAVSVLELGIKIALGKLSLEVPLEEYIERTVDDLGLELLPLRSAHAVRVASLPHHHRDPFDRALVAQAQVEGIAILSRDRDFDPYDVEVVW